MAAVKKLTGAALATAAAGLLLSGCAAMGGSSSDSMEAGVHCYGVNGCKGQTNCKSANNNCKGQNSCKGKGWLNMSKDECETKGGEIG